jgi:hypothetical protein
VYSRVNNQIKCIYCDQKSNSQFIKCHIVSSHLIVGKRKDLKLKFFSYRLINYSLLDYSKTNDTFNCNLCNKIYKTKRGCILHLNNVHLIEDH